MGKQAEVELSDDARRTIYESIRQRILGQSIQDLVARYRDEGAVVATQDDESEDLYLTQEELKNFFTAPAPVPSVPRQPVKKEVKQIQENAYDEQQQQQQLKPQELRAAEREKKKQKLDKLKADYNAAQQGTFTLEHPEQSHEKRDFTVSVAIPASILGAAAGASIQHGNAMSVATAGRLARLCNMWRVDEVVVYRDDARQPRIDHTKFLRNLRPSRVDVWSGGQSGSTQGGMTLWGGAEHNFMKNKETRAEQDLVNTRKKISKLIPDKLSSKKQEEGEEQRDGSWKPLRTSLQEIDRDAMRKYSDFQQEFWENSFETNPEQNMAKALGTAQPSQGSASSSSQAQIFQTNSSPALTLANIMYYLETPPYMRSLLFPTLEFLRDAALLHPLAAPHHQQGDTVSKYREGIVTDEGNSIYVGLPRLVIVDQKLVPGTRVTVELMRTYTHYIYGQLVPRRAPKQLLGTHWGYELRVADSIAEALQDCPYKEGYDVIMGHSDDESSIYSKKFQIPRFKHMMIVLESVAGLDEALTVDPARCQGVEPRELFTKRFNFCPYRGTQSSIRTEETLQMALPLLQEQIVKNVPPKPEHVQRYPLPFKKVTL